MKKFSVMSQAIRRSLLILQGFILVTASLVPLLSSQASAVSAQLTNRQAGESTAVPAATFQIWFQFRLPSSSAIQSAQFEFCDSPLGTCNTTNTPTIPAGSTVGMTTQSGAANNWTNATAFGTYVQQNGTSGGTNNQIKISRTQAAAETQSGVLDRAISFTGLTHKNTANLSFYVRIRLFSDTATATQVFDGNVAQSTSQTLTINARVQELLSFCVGSTTINNATAQIVPDCSTASGTSVDLGTISSSSVAITPVSATTGGDVKNAYAMVQTNAQNGVNISYRALQDTSSGKLKVVGATCSGVSTTDQCFNSQGTTQGAFTAGTENFGITVAGVNCGSVSGSAYTCTFASGCTNLQPQTDYVGDAYTYSSSCAGSGTFGTTNGFAWDDTGTIRTLASSASSSQKVVSNEALLLKFAATAQITTPTGIYQTQADFIATPTF